ncbi:MAG: glycerophosphodiester phosphodiesterase [Methanomicrobiales archaeon]|nr:glycerophosphodiester phosphodiesterase [Methanomicrobiales archaeon]
MQIVGHRGARAVAPENTLRAVRLGARCADFVEIDVRLSRDGVPVVIHDATLDRTTGGTGPVAALTAGELMTLDAGGGEHIPALAEACDAVRGTCGLVVEIKEPESIATVARVLAASAPAPLVIVSFHAAAIAGIADLLPGARTGLILHPDEADGIRNAVAAGADIVLPHRSALSAGLVAGAHREGLAAWFWTLNTEAEWALAVAAEADAVATDDPCGARSFLSR